MKTHITVDPPPPLIFLKHSEGPDITLSPPPSLGDQKCQGEGGLSLISTVYKTFVLLKDLPEMCQKKI